MMGIYRELRGYVIEDAIEALNMDFDEDEPATMEDVEDAIDTALNSLLNSIREDLQNYRADVLDEVASGIGLK